MSGKYVLAMYDVRAKQKFIFNTNKLQEIVGASWIIRDIFKDYLPGAADKACGGKIYSYLTDDEHAPFSPSVFEHHLENGYIGEVIYEGGGNFYLLYKDLETFRKVTYEFTKAILEKIGTLKVLGTAIEIESFENFVEDRKKLYAKHRKAESMESNIEPWACLPIVQVDRKTTRPLVEYEYPKDLSESVIKTIESKGVKGKLTKESAAKLVKFHREMERIKRGEASEISEIEKDFYRKNEGNLDALVTEKGVESQLAIVYIDGNNMGAKVQSALEDKGKSYEESIQSLRSFSEEIQKVYVEDGTKEALKGVPFRIVVSAGDEINFIVNAHDAFACAKGYLEYLKSRDNASACAGIAVFHSHAPYSDVYRIAEEACESGKQKMKAVDLDEAAFIDFHICQGAIGTSLEKIREKEMEGIKCSRPWMMWEKGDSKQCQDMTDYENDILPAFNFIDHFGRSNIKGLATAAKESGVALKMEINRMHAHAPKEEKNDDRENEKENMSKRLDSEEEKMRGIIYDISISYDLWEKDIRTAENGMKAKGE